MNQWKRTAARLHCAAWLLSASFAGAADLRSNAKSTSATPEPSTANAAPPDAKASARVIAAASDTANRARATATEARAQAKVATTSKQALAPAITRLRRDVTTQLTAARSALRSAGNASAAAPSDETSALQEEKAFWHYQTAADAAKLLEKRAREVSELEAASQKNVEVARAAADSAKVAAAESNSALRAAEAIATDVKRRLTATKQASGRAQSRRLATDSAMTTWQAKRDADAALLDNSLADVSQALVAVNNALQRGASADCDLRATDWLNRSYVLESDGRKTFSKGRARAQHWNAEFAIRNVTYRDLGGPPGEEAIVEVYCDKCGEGNTLQVFVYAKAANACATELLGSTNEGLGGEVQIDGQVLRFAYFVYVPTGDTFATSRNYKLVGRVLK